MHCLGSTRCLDLFRFHRGKHGRVVCQEIAEIGEFLQQKLIGAVYAGLQNFQQILISLIIDISFEVRLKKLVSG